MPYQVTEYRIYAYAIGIDSTGALDGHNPPLWNTPKTITCGSGTGPGSGTGSSGSPPPPKPQPTPSPSPSPAGGNPNALRDTSRGGPQSPHTINNVIYIHSDHLGSVSLITNSSMQSAGAQEFDPWGKVRTGGTVGTQTRLNFTNQKLDDSGLLYYHARMYDSAWGRFASPDSIVPGASYGVGGAEGTVGVEQNSKLTVDFHETGFLSSGAGENGLTLHKGFWFQLGGEDRGRADPSGPRDPQALDRYAYTLNNPLRYVNPTGHTVITGLANIRAVRQLIAALLQDPTHTKDIVSNWLITLGASVAGGLLAGPPGILFGLASAILQMYANDRLGEYIDVLKWMDSQLKIVDAHAGPDVKDDPGAWVGFWLDVNGSNCGWCLLSTNSVVNGQDGSQGVPNRTEIPEWMWFSLYSGSSGLQVTLVQWGGRSAKEE